MEIEAHDSYLPVEGGTVFVRRWLIGGACGCPIVLLHDSLGSVEQWREFPAELARATLRPVMAYDRLGFGKSSPRDERPTIDFIQGEARRFFPAIVQSLGVSRYSLFGNSVGGAMALSIAAMHLSRCEAVITESAQAFIEPRTLEGIRAARARFADPEQLARIVKWHGHKARWVLEAWTEVWLSPEFRSWTLEQDLAAVTCPVLAIHGDADEFGSIAFPRTIASRTAGRAEVAILRDCGHVPHREKTADVLRTCAEFLKSLPESTPR